MAKAAKGFSRLSVFPVTVNNGTTYTAAVKVSIPGAISFSASPDVSTWKINADDGIYDSGSDWNGMKFTLTIAECPLSLRQYFEGGVLAAGVYTYKSTSQAPELGLSFRVLQSDNTSLMVKLYSVKASSFKMDYKTKGDSGDVASVVIEGLIQNKVSNQDVKAEKETVTDADLTWLDTM